MNIVSKEIEKYVENYSTPEDKVMKQLNRETYLKIYYPNMLSGAVQGKILEMISCMIRPQRILEIGTFTGYSAICLAKGLSEDGRLFTIEADDEITGVAGGYIRKSGLSDRITLITGDAREIIPDLDESFDLVYLDAEKNEYLDYYELSFPKVREGGFILADNTLWGIKILDDIGSSDHFTRGIADFNESIRKDPRVEQVILPVRDGITLIRKI